MSIFVVFYDDITSSSMYTQNKRGPGTDPWGAPHLTEQQDDVASLHNT